MSATNLIDAVTYRLEVTLDVLDVPTTRTSWILRWLVNHVLIQPFLVEYAAIYNLQADNLRSFFEYIHGRGWHGPR